MISLLSQLPAPLAGNTDWPWSVNPSEYEDLTPDGSPWPKISIVTPSYNQGEFLEKTISSILSQGYPNLEYIIIDGGSSDNSIEIIKRYEKDLKYWCSEPDEGHYAAVNKGFSHATGEVFAWLNSDDMYCPWALKMVGSIFSRFSEVEWISTLEQLVWDRSGSCITIKKMPGYSRQAFLDGGYFTRLGSRLGFIQQESTFWRSSLWEKVGGLGLKCGLAGDFDLWGRFFANADLYGVASPLGGFRYHGKNRSLQKGDYIAEAERSLGELRNLLGLPKHGTFPFSCNSLFWRLVKMVAGGISRPYNAINLYPMSFDDGSNWEMKMDHFRA